MTFRKLKGDHLFTGTQLLNGSNVLIIKDNGTIEDIINEKEAGESIEEFNGLLCPGFINAHCHLELSHMKGAIPERTGLVDFVYKVINGRKSNSEVILSAISKAETEMINNGIVAVGDISNLLSTLSQKRQQNLAYYNFVELLGWNPSDCESSFKNGKKVYDAFSEEYTTTSIVPHAPYSVSEQLWERIIPFYNDKVVSMHNQETAGEDEYLEKGTGEMVTMYEGLGIDTSFYKPFGKSSLQSCFIKLLEAERIMLVHNTFTRQEDIDFVKRNVTPNHLISYCLCINANLYIENLVPPLELLLQNKCNIIVGTDSLASNHQLSILEELKTLAKYFPDIELETMLQWATLNGARALKMDNQLGSFEKNKTPGVVLIENIDTMKLTKDSKARRIL